MEVQNAAAGSPLMARHPQLVSSPPQTLLCLGLLFLALGQVTVVLSVLRWLLSVSNIATLIGVVCLVLAASSSLNRCAAAKCRFHKLISCWSHTVMDHEVVRNYA